MASGFRETQLDKQVNHRLSDLTTRNLVQFCKYLLGAYLCHEAKDTRVAKSWALTSNDSVTFLFHLKFSFFPLPTSASNQGLQMPSQFGTIAPAPWKSGERCKKTVTVRYSNV